MIALSHRNYFRTFNLSAAEYGEILVAAAFDGRKLAYAHPGYDVETDRTSFESVLRKIGGKPVDDLLALNAEQNVRIQVKSKLSENPSGPASVVWVKDSDLDAMTHLVICLVDGGSQSSQGTANSKGMIDWAWLMARDTAKGLRNWKPDVSRYIRVSKQELRDLQAEDPAILDIQGLLQQAADESLDLN